MPSLKADGSLRPDTRWKLGVVGVVGEPVSAVDLDIPEKRLARKAGTMLGARLALAGLVGTTACRDVCTCCIACSWCEGWLSVSWSAPPCLRL